MKNITKNIKGTCITFAIVFMGFRCAYAQTLWNTMKKERNVLKDTLHEQKYIY